MTDKATKEEGKRGLFPEEITNSYTQEYMEQVLFNPPVYRELLEKVKDGESNA